MQLIPPMLGDENAPRGIDGKAFAVAYPGGETPGRRKWLIRFVGIVTPYAATSLHFRTGVRARYVRLRVLRLAGVGRGTHVGIHRSFFIDDEWMHRMVAAKR